MKGFVMKNVAKMEAGGSPNEDQIEAEGAQMKTKMEEFRGHFATPSQEPSRGGFGNDSGWIWGRFWEGFGKTFRRFFVFFLKLPIL